MRPIRLLLGFGRAPWPLLLSATALGTLLSALHARGLESPGYCGAPLLLASSAAWRDAVDLTLALNPPAQLMTGWTFMLLAMMPPLLAMPLTHVWRASLARRRIGAVALFLLGYGAVWIVAGAGLAALGLLLHWTSPWEPLALVVPLAVLWSASPWQRAVLNRCHRLGRIGLFGWAARRDCLAFGATHAMWCVASCWAWMLASLLAGDWHLAAMAGVTLILLLERFARTGRPRWRLPVLGLRRRPIPGLS